MPSFQKCDTAAITIQTSTQQTVRLVLPAYTVPTDDLSTRIASIVTDYFAGLFHQDTTVASLADFTMYCLAQAATDPFEILVDDQPTI